MIVQSDAPSSRAGTSPGGAGGGSQGKGSDDAGHSVFVGGGGTNDNDFVSMNDLVWLDDVVGVEVYSSGLSAPAEFRGGGISGCPVVVIWTSMDADALDRAEKGSE